jgi:hypothetical protein
LNWSSQDNKKYRGKIDRIYVALSEYWEVDYFVDHYLKTRNYAVTDESRFALHGWLDSYPGAAPVFRADLERWLDGNVTRKSA